MADFAVLLRYFREKYPSIQVIATGGSYGGMLGKKHYHFKIILSVNIIISL